MARKQVWKKWSKTPKYSVKPETAALCVVDQEVTWENLKCAEYVSD